MDTDLILKTIQNYFNVLKKYPLPLVDASRLPSSKETLKRSIETLWFALEESELRGSLKMAFLSLANFQTGISPKFEDIFRTCQYDANSYENPIETQFPRLAEEKLPNEFKYLMALREKEIKALVKEIALWEQDKFE